MYGLSRVALENNLKTAAAYKNPQGEMQFVRLEQRVNGLPVFQGELSGMVNGQGELTVLVGDIVPGLEDDSALNQGPGPSAEDALGAAAESVGFAIDPSQLVRSKNVTDSSYVKFDPTAKNPVLSARQVYFPTRPGSARLAWQVVVSEDTAMYSVVVDYASGKALFRKDLVNRQTKSATYDYYNAASPAPWLPVPMSYSPETTKVLGFQAPVIKRSLETLVSESPTGDPDGWITDNDTFTRGNNTWVGRDQVPPTGVDPEYFHPGLYAMPYGNNNGASPSGRNFVYPRGDGQPWVPGPGGVAGPTVAFPPAEPNEPYDSGAVTNMFVWVNRYHDRLYDLGFTEMARNFQMQNFSRGGFESDPVLARGMSWTGCSNSNFGTPPDGDSGFMNMFKFLGMLDWTTQPARDATLDVSILLHELTHGLTNRLVGNAAGLNAQQAGGLGEGWSDFYALALLSDTLTDQDPDKIYPMSQWITFYMIDPFTQPGCDTAGVPFDNYYYGIRRYPYCTDLWVSPLTWSDADPRQSNNDDARTPESPICFAQAGVEEVHNLGEIWCAMLWQARAKVLNYFKQGGAPWGHGNQHVLQLVTDALKVTPIDGSFTDARDALLDVAVAQSDVLPFASLDGVNTTYAAMDELSTWLGFAARGLGFSAVAPPGNEIPSVRVYAQQKNIYNAQTYKPRDRYYFDTSLTSVPIQSRFTSDDDYITTTISDTVTFYGVTYNTIYVGSNGYITFGAGDSSPLVDIGHHFALPRISGLLADLDPTAIVPGTTPTVSWAIDANLGFFVVTYENVPEKGTTNLNSFQIAIGLDSSNPNQHPIILSHLGITAGNSIIGLSRGQGKPVDWPIPNADGSDLSEYVFCTQPTAKADYFTQTFPGTVPDVQDQWLVLASSTDLGWPSPLVEAFDLPVTCSQPVVIDPNGNGSLEPGETFQLKIPFTNLFQKVTLSDVFGTISTKAPGISIITGTAGYGQVGPQQSGMGVAPTFAVNIAPDVPCGATFSIQVDFVTRQTGATSTVLTQTFPFRVGRNGAPLEPFPYPELGYIATVRSDVTESATDIPVTGSQAILSQVKTGMFITNTSTSEIMRVTGVTGLATTVPSIKVVRGQDGTTARAMVTTQTLVFYSVLIPDNSATGVSPAVHVSGIDFVGNVRVLLKNITHPRVGDLTIKLTGPTIANTIVDNDDPTSRVGLWTRETSVGDEYGPSYLSTPIASVTFTPDLVLTGPYRVYEWHPAGTNRPAAATYIVNSTAGQTSLKVDQRNAGGTWNSIGTYNFSAGTLGSVMVTDQITETDPILRVAADAVKFVYVGSEGPVVDTIIDNDDPARVSVVGTWTRETSAGNEYGPSYLSTPIASVTFRPDLVLPGPYQVYEWHPAGASRPVAATYIVNSSAGQTSFSVNQRVNGGTWNSIGTYNFSAGTLGSVLVTDQVTETAPAIRVAADAIKFVYVGSAGGKTVTLLDHIPDGTALNRTANISNVTLSDEGGVNIQNLAQTTVLNGGVYLPAEALSAFQGQPASGEWKLTVIDSIAQNVGQVQAWELDVEPAVPQCPAVPLAANSFSASSEGWQSNTVGDAAQQKVFYSTAGDGRLILHTDPGAQPRIPFWSSPGVPYVEYANQIYRMKAYVNLSGQPDPNNQSQIPNMRLRMQARYSMANTLEIMFDPTQYDPASCSAMLANAPSTDPAKPTLYTVDFDPVDVPGLMTPYPQVITGMIENYSIFPNEQGNIEIAETVFERNSAPEDKDGVLVRTYGPADVVWGTPTTAFYDNPNPFSDTPYLRPVIATSALGVTLDSTKVPPHGYACANFDVVPAVGTEPVVKPGKMYRARYHVSSDTAADNNPQLRLRARTIKFDWNNKLEVGSARAAGELTNMISSQALPGTGTANPARRGTETNGGYYDQYFNVPNVLPTDDNLKRLRFGIDLIDGGYPAPTPSQCAVNGRFLLDSIEVMEFDQIP